MLWQKSITLKKTLLTDPNTLQYPKSKSNPIVKTINMNNCSVDLIVKNLIKTIGILRNTARVSEVRYLFPSPNKVVVEQVAEELTIMGYKPTILYGGKGVDVDVPFELRIPIN